MQGYPLRRDYCCSSTWRKSFFLSLCLWLSVQQNNFGQVPVCNISGNVRDTAGAVITSARVLAVGADTGLKRHAVTSEVGFYQFTNLPPGPYSIEINEPGFRSELRRITVQIGDHPSVDFTLAPGSPNERVEVATELAAINTSEYGVASSINRFEIENLPLNGRGFLELAQLEPSVKVVSVTNPGALGNNYQQVLFGGAYYSQTHISIDGSTVGDRFVGGTSQNFSQESIQEFQVSSFNFDLSNGNSASGAINIVTRRGSNDLHGAGFYYFRDHNLSAYPGLQRDARNQTPFFVRRQGGFNVGGPLKRDRLFWFTNYEHNNQDAVFAIANNHPIFSKFDGVYPNPLTLDLFNVRLDYPINDRFRTFLRFSLDKNNAIAPAGIVGMPSNWQTLRNRAFQFQTGVVSILSSKFINDLRFSHNYLGGNLDPLSPQGCRDPIACVGVSGPTITVFDAPQFRIGNQSSSPFDRWDRTYQIVDNLTWVKGSHQVRLGGEWEHVYLKALRAFQEPAQIVLWGPTNLKTPALLSLYNALPLSLRDPNAPPPTLAEILQLPFRSFSTGIGDPYLPGPYNFDRASRNDRYRLFIQDQWRARSNLLLSFGVAYSYDNNLYAHDLEYPAYLAPLMGDKLDPPRRDKNNLDPALGMAWTLGTTVLHAGAGIYTDEASFFWKSRDRAFIGPSGNGRVIVDGSITPLNFVSTPTSLTGNDFLPLLPAIRSNLAARFGNGTDLSVRGIDVIKQGDQIVDTDSTTAYGIHFNAGVQRQLKSNLVMTANYVMRRMVHVGALQGVFIIDRNRFNRPRVTGVNPDTGVVSFVRDPVIPLCTPAQTSALNPADHCSTGPINVFSSGANFRYQGLLLRIERRYSGGLHFTAGYTLAKSTGFIEQGFTSFDDYSKAYGNIPNQPRHRLTISMVWSPHDYHGTSYIWRALHNSWTFAFIADAYTAPALDTLLTGLDLDGDGISTTLLRGTTSHNLLGMGLSVSELRQLVSAYNADVESRTRRIVNSDGSVTVVRPRTPFNQIINPITVPETFSSGDSFKTVDVRLTRKFTFEHGVQLSLIGEAFNLFNIANLTGYSNVLNQPNYGLPSTRMGQVFGTGGPRAFQFAARLMF